MIEGTLKDSDLGPKRKYYTLTDLGKTSLFEFKDNYTTLNNAIKELFKGENL